MDAQAKERVTPQDQRFAVLQGADADTRYHTQVARACSILLQWYKERSNGDAQNAKDTFESTHMRETLERFLYTEQVLRVKHAYGSPDGEGRLHIDLTDSGFPNRHEIMNLVLDLSSKAASLRELPQEDTLKTQIIEGMFRDKAKPVELLHQLAQRTYFEMLDEKKLFLPYMPGSVIEWRSEAQEGVRGFVTGWACYGAEKNSPYTYLMHFDQDSTRPSLLAKEGAKDLSDLSTVIRDEGSRVPPLSVLGDQIDDQVTPIHPKFFKRTRIGPFFSQQLLEQRAEMDMTGTEKIMLDLFRTYGTEEDFILFTSEEILFSHGEYQGTRFLMPTKIRQAFYVPPTDREAYEEGASKIYHYAILPYRILQNLTPEIQEKLPALMRCTKCVGYDSKGRIHEVS